MLLSWLVSLWHKVLNVVIDLEAGDWTQMPGTSQSTIGIAHSGR